MICFLFFWSFKDHHGQSVSIRSRSSIQKEKKVPDSSTRLTPVCFGFFETLRPLSCFSGRHSSVSSSFSSSLGDISSSMLMAVFSCALAVVKRLDLGYKESSTLCSNNHKLKLLQVNLREKTYLWRDVLKRVIWVVFFVGFRHKDFLLTCQVHQWEFLQTGVGLGSSYNWWRELQHFFLLFTIQTCTVKLISSLWQWV